MGYEGLMWMIDSEEWSYLTSFNNITSGTGKGPAKMGKGIAVERDRGIRDIL